MPNRKVKPLIKEIDALHLPLPRKHILDNSIPLYEFCLGTQDILKLEIVYYGGRPFEQKRSVGRATGRMLKEGTASFSSREIAEKIDFYGGTLSIPVNLDTINITLYSLSKHFSNLLPVLSSILHEPSFPEKELQTYIRNNQQRLLIDLSKPEVVAYRKITELIFGEDHPYGYNSTLDTYGQLGRADLLKHFDNAFTSANCQIFLSGKTNSHILQLINQYIGQNMNNHLPADPSFPTYPDSPEKVRIRHDNTVQTAIRIGRKLFNRSHPDYKGFYILNTILGGYFGSRLMANIREDKGFTYHIYSSIDTMLYDGYFYIGTEVGNNYLEQTLQEIYREIYRLQTELIPEDELRMVRNYLLGTLMTSLDGAFNVADFGKSMILEQIPFSEFDESVKLIRSISPQKIRDLAIKYLQKDDLWEVVVGTNN